MPSCNLDNGLISSNDYEAISLLYSSAVETMKDAKQNLLDAVYQIVMIDVCIPEVDLLNTFWTAYELSVNDYKYPQSMLNAVRTLNSHVLNRGGYVDIDEYLEDISLTVSDNWQELSAEVGFYISDAYTEDFVNSWQGFTATAWNSFTANDWFYF